MTCHSKFAESPEARYLRCAKEVQAEMGGIGNRMNITHQSLTSSGARKRWGCESGNCLLYATEFTVRYPRG